MQSDGQESVNKIHYWELSRYINELIDEPIMSPIGFKVSKAIFKTIADALHRGEEVYVQGFGTFKVLKPREVHKLPNLILHRKRGGEFNSEATKSPVMIEIPGKKKVFFYPAIQLQAMLNEDDTTSNYKERRAKSIWSKED
jgi:nucleoid DNA-binding protein